MRYLKDLLSRRDLPVWRMPVAYADDLSRLFTLDELVALKPAIKVPAALNGEEWRTLVLAQMRVGMEHERSRPGIVKYQLGCPAGFVHGYSQALDEVERRTALGEVVLRYRREYVTALIADVFGGESSGPWSR